MLRLQFKNSQAWIALVALLIAMVSPAFAGDTDPVSADDDAIDSLDLEALMDVEISTVSRKKTRVAETPAAAYVVTGDEIRAYGITNIPDALRLVPGMQVARVDGNAWAVTARGFNDPRAKRLLVLMDGRTLYSATFGSVAWHFHETLIEDIDRIEVVRGPGGTLWGANAVNGIVNIITKQSQETQGTMLSAGVGRRERYFASARYGGSLGEDVSYRGWAKYFERGHTFDSSDSAAHDQAWMTNGGTRVDWTPSDMDLVTFQAGFNDGRFQYLTGQGFAPATERGFDYHAMARWTRRLSETSEFSLQAFVDQQMTRSEFFGIRTQTADLDFQHRFELGNRNDIVWGAGYRLVWDHIGGNGSLELDPDHRRLHLFSGFFQDEITLIRERLVLTAGSKVEHNRFTGFEFQPSVRLLFTPSDRQSAWAAVTRSVRTPTREELDLDLNGGLLGNKGIKSSVALSYELGYRLQPHESFAFDVALHYTKHRRLLTIESLGNSRLEWGRKLDSKVWGAEVAWDWKIRNNWKLNGGYTWLAQRFFIDRTARSASPTGINDFEDDAGENPSHQFHLRTHVALPWNLDFAIAGYWVGSMRALVVRGLEPAVSSYMRLDTRIGWRPRPDLEVSLVGQNLLDSRHFEYLGNTLADRTQIPRLYYVKLTWTR